MWGPIIVICLLFVVVVLVQYVNMTPVGYAVKASVNSVIVDNDVTFTISTLGPFKGVIMLSPDGGGLTADDAQDITFDGTNPNLSIIFTPTSSDSDLIVTMFSTPAVGNPAPIHITVLPEAATSMSASFLSGVDGNGVATANSDVEIEFTPDGIYNGSVVVTPSGAGMDSSDSQTINWNTTTQSVSYAKSVTFTPTVGGPLSFTYTVADNTVYGTPITVTPPTTLFTVAKVGFVLANNTAVAQGINNFEITPNPPYIGTIALKLNTYPYAVVTRTYNSGDTSKVFSFFQSDSPASAGTYGFIIYANDTDGAVLSTFNVTFAVPPTIFSYDSSFPSTAYTNQPVTNTVSPNGLPSVSGTVTLTASGAGTTTRTITATQGNFLGATSVSFTGTSPGTLTIHGTSTSASLVPPSDVSVAISNQPYTVTITPATAPGTVSQGTALNFSASFPAGACYIGSNINQEKSGTAGTGFFLPPGKALPSNGTQTSAWTPAGFTPNSSGTLTMKFTCAVSSVTFLPSDTFTYNVT